jgi:hypothetical protein
VPGASVEVGCMIENVVNDTFHDIEHRLHITVILRYSSCGAFQRLAGIVTSRSVRQSS